MGYIIAGLGNPGEEYENTRHNTGRIVLDVIRKKLKEAEFGEFEKDKKTRALVAKGKLKEPILLVEPEDFMNKSGQAVKSFVTSKKAAEKLIVIHDDLDLPIGRYKICFNRGSGGHKGVESIMRAVGTEGFVRFRIGISPATPSGKMKKPSGEKAVSDFILGKFKPAEITALNKAGEKLTLAVEIMIKESREKAMSVYN